MSAAREELPGLPGVSQTMLVCLCERVRESRRGDAVLRDPAAERIAESIPVDCDRYGAGGWSQVATSIRSAVFDRRLREILEREPGAVVVNLGAGLCTRPLRVAGGWSRWFDVDLPETEPAWRRWIGPGGGREYVAASLASTGFLDAVAVEAPRHVFIAEGSLIYVPRPKVVDLLDAIAARLPGSHILLDAIGPFAPWLTIFNRAVHRTGARFQWGVRSLAELTDWCPRLRLVDEWFYLDEHPERWGRDRWLRTIPLARAQMKAGHLRAAPYRDREAG